MNLISYISNISDIDNFVKANIREAIICPSLLSKFGKLSIKDVNEIAIALKEKGITPILEWDILMTESVFSGALNQISKIDFKNINYIRAQDPGVINYILKNHKDMKIQLLLDSGAYHNERSIKIWFDIIGDRLDRIILSLELSKETIFEYLKSLNVDIEILGVGRILLFYTPRKLLTPLFDEEKKEYFRVNEVPVEMSASSEESAHKGFPVIENIHGTFMFNTKDYFILEYVEELKANALKYLRIDLRFIEDQSLIVDISRAVDTNDLDKINEVKNSWPVTVIRGFFHVNKSDVLFKKLKNQKTLRVDEFHIGEVIDVNKKNYIMIQINAQDRSVKIGDKLKLKTPDGKVKILAVTTLRNTQLQSINEASCGDIIIVPHIGGVSVKTQVLSE